MMMPLSEWTMPSFFTPEVLEDLNGATRMIMTWGMPLIMIVVALIIAGAIIDNITDMFVKKKAKKEDDEDDDFDVYRYS
jgi:hypothetical protein